MILLDGIHTLAILKVPTKRKRNTLVNNKLPRDFPAVIDTCKTIEWKPQKIRQFGTD